MSKKTKFKICPYCQTEFEVEIKSRQEYCKRTCSTYMSQVRAGKRELPVNKKLIKKDTLEPSIEGLKDRIKEAATEIQRLSVEIPILEKEFLIIRKNLNTIYGKSSYNRELKYFDDKVKRYNDFIKKRTNKINTLQEEDKEKIENQIISFEQEQQQIQMEKEEYQQKVKISNGRYLELKGIIKNKIVEKFRLFEFYCQAIKTGYKGSNFLPAKMSKMIKEHTATYPFSDFIIVQESYSFLALGKPPQPFICNVFGKKEEGKTNILLTLCKDFIDAFNSKIFYVVDFDDIDLENKLESKEILLDNVSILRLENRKLLTQYLPTDDYEFLILDVAKSYTFTYSFLINLQRQYPKLSIFLSSVNPLKSLTRGANIILEVSNGVAQLIKGGFDDYCILGWKGAKVDDFEGTHYPNKVPTEIANDTKQEGEYIDYEEVNNQSNF